ncbi:MAG: SUMF1/EgtB/PvdO family nonheme iron enzyme [Rhodospirillaceae bacterium]|nr:SUMF1/EgtB/PvdO family nonheme iron enzyme [Rhodospirillaceae bacterium]
MRALLVLIATVLFGFAAAAQPQSGETFKDCETCPEMMVLPTGKAWLGAEPWDQDMKPTWAPLREVTINYAFAVAKLEITRAQYREFVKATKYESKTTSCNTWGFNRILGQTEGYAWDNPGQPQRDDAPVVCVSWQDATAFVNWLAKKTKKPYRLLSSTEFEYATRAGTRGPWFWGPDNAKACEFANVADDTYRRLYSYGPVFACNDNWERLAPVGSFKANPWGLHDMLGNAWEWTEDCFHADMSRIPTDGRAWGPEDGGDCAARTPRGGAWASGTDWLKAIQPKPGPRGLSQPVAGLSRGGDAQRGLTIL